MFLKLNKFLEKKIKFVTQLIQDYMNHNKKIKNKQDYANHIQGNKLTDGTGGFGKIYYIRSSKTITEYTLEKKKIMMKKFKPLGITSLKEFDMQYNCCSPYILKIKDFHIQNEEKWDSISFIYDLGKCDLWTFIKKYDVPFSHRKIIMFQMIFALYHCHGHGIVHFDVKLNNFIIFYRNGFPYVYLSDFGLSYWHTNHENSRYHSLKFYTPLEYFKDSGTRIDITKTSTNFDIWGLAHSFYELMTGKQLIKGDPKTEIKQIFFDNKRIFTGDIKDNLKTITSFYIDIDEFNKPSTNGIINTGSFDDFMDLMSKMFEDENIRYTTEQCLKHNFFK